MGIRPTTARRATWARDGHPRPRTDARDHTTAPKCVKSALETTAKKQTGKQHVVKPNNKDLLTVRVSEGYDPLWSIERDQARANATQDQLF